MNLNLMALGLTAVAAICLGIAVYQRNPDRVWNRLFAVHATGGGLWTFVNYMIMAAGTPAEAGVWLRISHPVVAMVICSVVDFAWVFPERIDYVDPRRRVLLYGIGALVGTVAFAPDLYHEIVLGPGVVNVTYGWAFIPFGLFTVCMLGYADFVLLRKALHLQGVQRVQVIWVLIGLAVSHIVAIMAIIVIPIVWATTAYSGWGAGGYITTLAGMGYSIARHRLMRPSIAFRRMAIASVSALVVVSLGGAGLLAATPLLTRAGVPLTLVFMLAGIGMGTAISIAHAWVTKVAHRSQGESSSLHAGSPSEILRTLDSERLLRLLARSLDDELETVGVAVYTRSRSRRQLVPRVVIKDGQESGGNGQGALDLQHVVLDLVRDGALVTRDQVFRFAPQGEARRLSLAMDELGAQAIAPLIWEDELIGAVTLGAKRSGEMYAEEELRFVAEVALQASLAIRNADLYAETATLKDFNERILSQMDNAVVVTDAEETIVVFNAAAERLFGIPADEARNSTVDVLPEGIARCIRASLGSGRILSSRHFQIQQGDEAIPLACSTSPLEGDGEQRRQGSVAVISDLTLIQELERERQEAERLALIRVISAGMAHEIRNPLVAIRTFAELAPRRLDDPEFRSNFLTVVCEEIRRIDKLVGDLLTLSKPADAVVEEIDIGAVCQGVMRAMAGVAEAREVELRLELDEIDGVTSGDETRLHQALLNLVSNAIDAEPGGGVVTLKVEECAEDAGGRMICISVHNPSSFIPREQIEEIFRPFVSKKATGTGLGLAICQTIIEEHRGDVRVESTR
ncbi:MAG: ATP-binding protein, partial [Armatimonadota bacterium]